MRRWQVIGFMLLAVGRVHASLNPINCVQSVGTGAGIVITGSPVAPVVSVSPTDTQLETYISSVTVNSNLQVGGYVQILSQTLAQLQGITPTSAGQLYYCSNCVTASVCVSTGTTPGAFATVNTRATACN